MGISQSRLYIEKEAEGIIAFESGLSGIPGLSGLSGRCAADVARVYMGPVKHGIFTH